MKTRTLLILAILAVVLALAAFFASKRGDSGSASASTAGRERGAKFFADLTQRVNDVAEVTVTEPPETPDPDAAPEPELGPDGTPIATPPPPPTPTTKTFVITKQGDAWGAAEKGGYPVDVNKVKALVVGIAEFTTLAEMTKNKTYYNKLGVEDINEPKAASKRVTLKDASGKVLADVLIGRAVSSQGPGGGKPSLYVRRVGEDQAFEVSGNINVATDATSWLDLEVSKLEPARVNRVVTKHPAGEVLEVKKDTDEDKNFTVVGLPEGEELMWPGVADAIASALQSLRLEDVQKNENFDMSGATVTEFTTFDGMRVTVKTLEKDGKTWTTLNAAFDPTLIVEAPPAEVTPPPEGETPADAPPTPPKPVRKSAEEVQKEVDALNAKVGPWVYAVPGYGAANMRKHMSDLLKKKEEAAADAALQDAAGDDMPLPPIDNPPPPPVKDDGHDH